MRWYEAFVIACEPEHAHAVDACTREPFAEAGRHRSKIFADHDGAMPIGFLELLVETDR